MPTSKFDLRDISQRLAASQDTEAVVFEFLGYLQGARPDWRPSLSFYEVSRDALVNVYTRHESNLVRRDVLVSVDHLPPRLVRKFFHSSAFSNVPQKRSLLSNLFRTSPFFEPDPHEAGAIQSLCYNPSWNACVCLPLADQEDLLALLILISERKGAFGGPAVDEVVPVKNMAALALAQRLYRSARKAGTPDQTPHAAASEFQDKIRALHVETSDLAEQNRLKTGRLESLQRELEALDRNSSEYQQELERVKGQLFALEEQSTAAAEHLREAQSQVNVALSRVAELQRTIGFMKEVFQVLGQEYDIDDFARTMVTWFCEHFGVERCSLMLLEDSHHTLQIAAFRGLDPRVAEQVRVRLGQGIAGWVAHHRKPLLLCVKSGGNPVQHTDQDVYNSDSFISVPMVFNSRLSGVLNLSNKKDGAPFDELDLDRAVLTGSVLAMILGSRDLMRRVAA
ncbi:MAG: GAF domain-containing protein [Candidatus Eisenbacteria bacterium]|uniref:GAF domain-containing protein n=1 Tax=Eiseniibacteriota bacterium TaxID=2212470 RepID=A0A538U775_UNCEI|nr:MAG: GAF domain-containing protein [Candidatus Eisenbacteria bacterium]